MLAYFICTYTDETVNCTLVRAQDSFWGEVGAPLLSNVAVSYPLGKMNALLSSIYPEPVLLEASLAVPGSAPAAAPVAIVVANNSSGKKPGDEPEQARTAGTAIGRIAVDLKRAAF